MHGVGLHWPVVFVFQMYIAAMLTDEPPRLFTMTLSGPPVG